MNSCPTCGATYDDVIRICPKDGTVLESSPEARDPRIGEVLDGKYRLDARLGQGGMGAIYRATHLMLDKQVAVKLIKPELVGSPDLVRRFQREARAAGNLSHPNIAAAYDLGQTADGTLYIAMELVRGRSLKDVIRETGPLGVDRIIRILRQIGSALALAHRHGIIHRDLKPHNVMLAEDDGREVAKLLDFGIAKTFDDASTQLTATGFVLGTPQYMSPEQAAGRPIDGRSDLYSLGIILYEMLTGEVPFNDPSTPALLVKHLTETPPPPSRRRPDVPIPAALETIALRLLAKDPADRFQTADELLAALPAETATAPVVTVPPAMDKTVVLPPPGAARGATPAPAEPTVAMTPPVGTTGDAQTPAPSAVGAAPPPADPTAATPVVPASGPTTPAGASAPAAAAAGGALAGAATPPAFRSEASGAVAAAVQPEAAPAASSPSSASGAGPVAAAATSAPARSRPLTDMLVLVGLMALIVVGGAFAGMRFGLFGGGDSETTTAAPDTAAATMADAGDTSMAAGVGEDTMAGAAVDEAAVVSEEGTAGAADAGTPGGATASSATSAAATTGTRTASGAPSSPAPAVARPAAATPASSAPAAPARVDSPPAPAAASAAGAASATQTAAALPAVPAVGFGCEGAPQVCSALRAAMADALGRHSLRPVAANASADVRVTANVSVVDESSEQLFGSTFVIRTYSVEFTGETADGDLVPMPAPTTLTFDAAYAQQKLPQEAQAMSTDAAGRVQAYWRSRVGN